MKALAAALMALASTTAMAWNSIPSLDAYKIENSPNLPSNSQYNLSNTGFLNDRGIYDSDGTQRGYVVPRNDGGGPAIYDMDGGYYGRVPYE